MRFTKALKFGDTVVLLSLAAGLATGQQAPSQADQPYPVHTIKEGRLYWVPGGPGDTNTILIIGDRGVIVVDPKTDAASGKRVLEIAAQLTSKPVTHVIETHSDADHVNGIVAFPKDVKIIAHVNNRFEQQNIRLWKTSGCVPPPDRLPDSVISKDKVAQTIDGVRFVFYYFGPAHTSGDLVIQLPDYRIAAAGDILVDRGVHPSLKFEKHGSMAGWFKNMDGLLSLDVDQFITGHGGKLFSKDDVRGLMTEVRGRVQKIETLAASGKPIEEIEVAMGEPAVHPSCLGILQPTSTFTAWNEWTIRQEEAK